MKRILKAIILVFITLALTVTLIPVVNTKKVQASYTARIAICSTYGSPYTVFVGDVWDELEERGCYVGRISSSSDISQWDALVIPGGADVDPSCYGESDYACGTTNKTFDNEQLAIIDKFVKAGKPILGMCRGLQILNVYFGGTLYQNISGHNGGVFNYATTVSGSMMANLIGSGASTYCYHHQCIKTLGSGLKATMYCGNIIEAVEHTSLPIIATQWHPERTDTWAGDNVLDHFVYDMVCGYYYLSDSASGDGNWYTRYSISGYICYYTGFADNKNGRWRVENGKVNFGYNNVVYESGQWRYYSGGMWQKNATTLAANEYGWWMINNGVVNFNYTGFADNKNGRWRVEGGKVNFGYNNVVFESNQWRCYKGGMWQKNATTVAGNSNGWWYIKNGVVDFTFNGRAQNENGWWYLQNGKVDFGYTGYVENQYGRWRVENGKVNFDYNTVVNESGQWRYYSGGLWRSSATTVAHNENGWWYIENGVVDFSYNGFAKNENGWWYIVNGKVDFSCTGFIDDTDGRWRVEGGKINFDYTDIVQDEGEWRYYKNGVWQSDVTTVAHNENGWWVVDHGVVDFDYTGLASNENGRWYIENGKVNFSYTGTYTNESGTWNIVNGKVA